jgi:hypothetical protein
VLGLAASFLIVLLGAVLLLATRPNNNSEKPQLVAVDPNVELPDVIVESGKTLSLNAEDYLGRKIITQDDAGVLITFIDGTQVELDSDTQVKLVRSRFEITVTIQSKAL